MVQGLAGLGKEGKWRCLDSLAAKGNAARASSYLREAFSGPQEIRCRHQPLPNLPQGLSNPFPSHRTRRHTRMQKLLERTLALAPGRSFWKLPAPQGPATPKETPEVSGGEPE